MSSAVFSIKAKRNDTWLWKQLTSGWWWENIVSRVSASFRWIWMFFRYSVSHEASVNARSRNKHGGREQNRGTVRPARTTQTARTIKRSPHDDDQITAPGSRCRSQIKHRIREKTRRLEGTQQNAAALFSTETERTSAQLTSVQNLY